MTRGRITPSLTLALSLMLSLLLVAAPGCKPSRRDVSLLLGSPVARAREQRLENAKAEHGTTMARGAPLAVWVLPRELHEVSGLALMPDGLVLAHGDEFAQLWAIDVRHGIVVKEFTVGKEPVKGDFEGITAAGNDVFLVTSKGKLYKFKEGKDGSHVNYEVIDTNLDKQCEFEGVAYDRSINSLLLACKIITDKAIRDGIVIYRVSLADTSGRGISRLVIPRSAVTGGNNWKELKPSDITVDPLSGSYVLVSAVEKLLLVVKPDGSGAVSLPLPPNHYQPEGVSIAADSIIMVSDEGGGSPAMITLYRWP